MSSSATSRPLRRSVGSAAPEPGVAEWASKIKAMQRQVDEDDEAEQRKLQEEIAASRLKRLRRSQMQGGNSRPSSLEIARSANASPQVPNDSSEDVATAGDRQIEQTNALRKLVGDSRPRSPLSPVPAAMQTPPAKSTSVSLAAFIGGRATGPRLNKHAPQQDAHDPTQFQQYSRNTAPHPAFGKGAVAMPGMGNSMVPVPPSPPAVSAAPKELHAPTTPEPNRRGASPISRRYLDKVEEQAADKTRGKILPSNPRERTMSTPTAPSKILDLPASNGGASLGPASRLGRAPVHQQSEPRPTSPSAHASNRFSATPPRSHANPALSTPPSTSSPASKSPITTPSLARPVQPVPKPSPNSPQLTNPSGISPAFLRTPVEKQPTPSLTRLKGRGFVQNMVRTSTELEAAAFNSPGEAAAQSGSGGRSSAKKPSVLDRYQPAMSSPTPPPIISPKPAGMRKSFTMDPSAGSTNVNIIRPADAERSVKSPSSPNYELPKSRTMPALASNRPAPSSTEMGVGSANTLLSYIRPTKTGDRTPPQRTKTPIAPPKNTTDDVDEFGVQQGKTAKPSAQHDLPPPSAPLVPLTKDRAKKPRKGTGSKAAAATPEKTRPSPIAGDSLPNKAASPSFSPQLLEMQPGGISSRPAIVPKPEALQRSTSSIADRWAEQPIIGVKPIGTRKSYEQLGAAPRKPESNGMVGRRPLPGMAPTSSETTLPTPLPADTERQSPTPTPSQKTPPSPARHTRIPSTGSRATVMDMAQVFEEEEARSSRSVTPSPSPTPPPQSPAREPSPVETRPRVPSPTEARPSVHSPAEARPRIPSPVESWSPLRDDSKNVLPEPTPRLLPPAPSMEKRKSSYEKYSAFILPPLQEEKTPVATPVGTLPRGTILEEIAPPEPHDLSAQLAALGRSGSPESESDEDVAPESAEGVAAPSGSGIVHFDHVDGPLPKVDVASLMKTKLPAFAPSTDISMISVDIMTIAGNAAAAVTEDSNIFYDTDVVAIIHRFKSKASGLVATQLWGWRGKRSHHTEKEDRKLQELAKRYNTSMVLVAQHCEPAELLSVLGGQLVVRQGPRTHWSSENTSMHLIRAYNGGIFIDEHDLNIRNLCSAFSYCLSILDNVYVWHGCGSSGEERRAAMQYAQRIAVKGADVVELAEGKNDDDEMFWMMLGDEEYAKADYWQWRPNHVHSPRVWRIDTSVGSKTVQLLEGVSADPGFREGVYLFDCVWEFFVVVCTEARAKRQDIRMALSLATALSSRVASSRPFKPPIHVLVLPSQLPIDLRLAFRDLDETQLNDGCVPDHINILPAKQALEHLSQSTWRRSYLKDTSFLPLGLHPSNLT